MKIYIAGPISGEVNAEQNFKKAHIQLARMYPNAEIKNPMLVPSPKFTQDDWGNDGVWSYYMHECIKLMMDCDTIFLLKGWSSSRGATIEHDLAWKLNMNIMYEEEVFKHEPING